MKVFHCDHCQQLVFFENVSCVKCGRTLAYLPDRDEMASLEPAEGGIWKSRAGKAYRLCENYSKEKVCNWAIAAESADGLCESCRLTRVIPDLGMSGKPGEMVSTGSGEAAIALQPSAAEVAVRDGTERAGIAIRVPGRLAGTERREGT